MSNVSIKILSEAEIKKIHETSLRVLETIGVDIEDEKIRSKLLSAGAKKGTTNNRVLIS